MRTRNVVSGARKKKQPSLSWKAQTRLNRFGKPFIFMLAFMFVGASTLLWASAATTTYGLWDTSNVPKIITATDKHNLELGMKFKSSVAGDVTGVKFYKGAQNTGQHTGSLWNNKGRLLATVAFKNETRTGWQTAMFDKPVSIAANVTYVVSYHAPKGHYSVDFKYFKNRSHINQKLTALKAVRGEPNGVYKYSSATSFPKENGSGANYWVDVVFTTKRFSPPVAPAAPANLTANLQGDKTVLLKWQASVSSQTITHYLVYRNGSKIAQTASTNYTDKDVKAATTYKYEVKSVDSDGATSAASQTITIAVPASGTTTPGTGGSGSGNTGGNSNTGGSGSGGGATPTGVNLFNASKKEIAMQLVSSAENSSLNWKAQYAYIEDIGDGRGYTAGIIGFCSGTGDMLEMIQYYTKLSPNNVLAKYIPALQKVNGTESHAGLGNAFVADWKKAASDAVFRKAQDYERDTYYFNPAVNQAVKDGLRTLGQFAYYDAMVMHGPGNDPVSFGGIRATALKKAKTPAQGGDEKTYINAFLDARKAAMLTESAHEDTDRVDKAQRVFLQQGNFDLNVPLRWSVYGDSYQILTNP